MNMLSTRTLVELLLGQAFSPFLSRNHVTREQYKLVKFLVDL